LWSEASISSVTKNATSIWRSVVSTASQVFGVSVPLSDAAEEVLSELSDDASSHFDERDPCHAEILRELWVCLFSGSIFEKRSPMWKSIGFQNEDPILDLKNSGILAIICITYMGEKYKEAIFNNYHSKI
jgi:hypothetical protein